MESPTVLERLLGFPIRLTLATLNPRSNIYRALITNPGAGISLDEKRIYARNLEVPSGGGVGTARAIARAYGVFATGGRELELRSETLQLLMAPAIPSEHGFYDECMKGEIAVLAGLHETRARSGRSGTQARSDRPERAAPIGFADPQAGIGYAYVTNRMGTALTGDPRDVALRRALPPIGT